MQFGIKSAAICWTLMALIIYVQPMLALEPSVATVENQLSQKILQLIKANKFQEGYKLLALKQSSLGSTGEFHYLQALLAFNHEEAENEKLVQAQLEKNGVCFQSSGPGMSRVMKKAMADLKYAIAKDAQQPKYYELRSRVRRESCDFLGALEDLYTMIALDQKNSPYYVQRADFLWRDGHMCLQPVSAIEKFSDPVMRKTLLELANQKKLEGVRAKFAELSMIDVNRALRLAPRSQEALALKASILESNSRYEDAIEDYDKLLSISPGTASYYDSRANAYSSLHEYEKAISDWTSAARIDPSKYEYVLRRAECYLTLGKNAETLRDCNSLHLSRKDSLNRTTRGDLYFHLHKYQEALADWLCYPNLATDNYQLARVAYGYQCMGKRDSAIDYWRKCLKSGFNDDGFNFKFRCLFAKELLDKGDKVEALKQAHLSLANYKLAVKHFPTCSRQAHIYPGLEPEEITTLITKIEKAK